MKKKSKISIICISLILMILLMFAFCTIGSVRLTLGDILSAIISTEESSNRVIILSMRLPRNIIAVLVGASLAVSGLLLQAVMKNPLSDPGVTGVSSGASVASIVILLLLPQYISYLPIFAFVGGAIACIIVYVMAWKNGLKPMRVVLSGVAVNAVLGGFISLITTLYSDKIQNALLWLNGSLASKTWNDVRTLVIYLVPGLILSLMCIRSANILSLGDETATSLGYNVTKTRVMLSAIAVFLAGTATSVVGVIGFVGLIVPHICRMIIGTDHKYTIPFSMILGGVTLLIADTAARSLFGSLELPVGIIMSIAGGPFFLYLLRKKSS